MREAFVRDFSLSGMLMDEKKNDGSRLILKKNEFFSLFFDSGYCHFPKDDYNIWLAERNYRVPLKHQPF